MTTTRKTTRASPVTTTTTTPVTNCQLKALIDQGVANALVARDADRSWNGNDSYDSRTGSRRIERTTRECTYTEFLKYQPMNFKGTEGVVVGQDAAHNIPWGTLIKMMAAKYCPQNEIKKLEIEIWKLKVKGTNMTSYTQRFQGLALICERMFLEESDKIKRYVCGLPDMIHGSVIVSRLKAMQDAVEFETELMDKKIHTFAEC
nr:reverse transcriptase domain-containing protein [Tanacetum cinerariifolium]